MTKVWKKLLAGVLTAGVILGSMPAQTLHAEETGDQPVQQTEEPGDQPVQHTEETGDQPVRQTDESGSATSQPGDGTGDEGTDVVEENTINFVYVESPYLETPDTQRIVFMFDKQITGADAITLTVEDSAGNAEEWELSRQEDNLYLFEKEYSGDAYSDTYRAVSLNLYGENTDTIILEEQEIEAQFGVDQEYSGIEELTPVEGETGEDAPITASIVTIDENGVTEAQDSIGDALNAVGAGASASTGSSTLMARSRAARAVPSGSVVVALDPGHDSKHTGAQGHGLREEALTLKIANYCKDELEKYAGVSVYMTRTGASCPYPNTTSSGKCIEQRVAAAASKGAQIYVSFHLNSSVSSSPKGAEVIVPNRNWKAEIGKEGEALARKILDELVKLGLSERKIYSRDSDNGSTYDDGSTSDYFTVQNRCKERDIPGIIVEHAFLSNSSDVNNYLKTETGLKKLGVADAKGIAQYLGLAKIGDKVQIQEGTYVLESSLKSGKVLSVADSSQSNQAAITLNSSGNKSSQRFEVRSAGDGYYYIMAEHSGKVLDVRGGSTASKTPVQQYTLSTSAKAQKWAFVYAGNGYYYLQSALGTCLDVTGASTADGTPIQTYAWNKSAAAQKWKLIESSYHPVADGTYTFANGSNNGFVLDVANASRDNKANVQLASAKNTSSQRFEVTYVGGGYYKILAEHSGKSFDVTSGSSSNGANLQQYAWANAEAQLWKFVDAGNGYYYLRSKCGTVVDIASKTPANGVNAYLWQFTGSNSQKWKVTASSYRPVKDGEYIIASAKSGDYTMAVSGSNIQLSAFTGGSEQKFKVTYVSGGYYKIISSSTGKALDVANGSADNKTNLQVYTWNNTSAQLWKFVDAGNGSYYIKSKLGTTADLVNGKLTSGNNIQMYAMSNVDAQKWKLDSSRVNMNERPVKDGTYMIQNSSNTAQVLDVQGGAEKNGANIQLYKSNNTSAQRYEVTYVGNGYYKIMSERTGRVLDVRGGSSAAGTNLQLYEWNSKAVPAQLWRFIPSGNGEYYIQSKLGTVIDIKGSTAASKTNVEMDTKQNTKVQRWKLVSSESKPLGNGGVYSIRSSSTSNLVLDISNGSTADKAKVWLYNFNNTPAQKFKIQYVSGGYYQILSVKSGKALAYDTSKSGNKAAVWQTSSKGSDEQLWKFIQGRSGGYYIRSKSGKVLDVTGGKFSKKTYIQMYTMNDVPAQKWALRAESEYAAVNVPNGTYTIQTALSSNLLLDVAGGATTNKTNIQIYSANDTASQKFKVQAVGDGYYKIISERSGKALDVSGGSMGSGANVQQYTWNNSAAQLWKFVDAGNGSYYIQSKLGNFLDVQGGYPKSGTNVQVYSFNKTASQKWILDDNRDKLYKIMGTTSVTAKQMAALYNSRGVKYPYADTDVPTIESFCQIYIEECKVEGVKAEVAFAQAMLETGFLKFGGDVKKEQYNFAGIGATGGGAAGASFKDIRTGIRAQVQHLKAYASKDALKQACVDPRFNYVKRGSAEYVQWLGIQENPNGGGWASAAEYGYNILKLIDEL